MTRGISLDGVPSTTTLADEIVAQASAAEALDRGDGVLTSVRLSLLGADGTVYMAWTEQVYVLNNVVRAVRSQTDAMEITRAGLAVTCRYEISEVGLRLDLPLPSGTHLIPGSTLTMQYPRDLKLVTFGDV